MNKYVFEKTPEQLRESQQSGLENAFCGFIAAFFSAVALCPTELVKCKMQALKDLGHPKKL